MGESGCLKDGHFQNLSCEGNMILDGATTLNNTLTVNNTTSLSRADIENSAISETLQVQGLARLTNISSDSSPLTIEQGTLSQVINLDGGVQTSHGQTSTHSHGKIITCNWNNGQTDLQINLPNQLNEYDVGLQITIIQGTNLVHPKDIHIVTSNGTFSKNSYCLGYESGHRVLLRPTDDNKNAIKIKGNHNSLGVDASWGIGSMAVFTYVKNNPNVWHCALREELYGNGNSLQEDTPPLEFYTVIN